MTVPREVQLKLVLKMLDACASDHERRDTPDGIMVEWQGKSYRLPSGRHGRRDTAKIGTAQVRQMVRHFGIDKNCAGKKLPKLAASF